MSKEPYSPSVLMIMIGVLIMTLSIDVSAQPTVDDEAYCQSTSWEEAVKQIRADLKLTMRDELTEVKNLLGSRQQPCELSATDASSLCKWFARILSIHCSVETKVV